MTAVNRFFPTFRVVGAARAGLGALLAVALAWLSGCASGPSYPPAPTTLPAALDYTYIIGPGDGLNVSVWRNPELSMSVVVRPDGKVNAPLVDELVAQGKTPEQLAREVEKILGKYVRDPVVTVMVTGFVGPTASRSASSARPPSRSSCPTRTR